MILDLDHLLGLDHPLRLDEGDAEQQVGCAEQQVGGAEKSFATVTELARDLGITPRALRFYEDRGLIAPRRAAATRIYTHRDRARMVLILRGKRLGFTLREIKDYLDLYDADPRHITQARALLKKIEDRRVKLEDQRIALDQALAGLNALAIDARATLERVEAAGPAARV